MWADNTIAGGTHIRFDGSGLIQGASSRFEVIGNFNGLWLNAQFTNIAYPQPRIIFNISGTECGRFSPASPLPTSITGRFMRIGLNPANADAARRLEVFDLANAPQFRITKSGGTVFTDFQVTGFGDLVLDPRDNTIVTPSLRPRFVGIHTLTPGNTLEINSQALSPGGNGSSGLRFTDLRYGISVPSAPLINQGVLSVNATGDVVYISGGGTGFAGLCVPGPTPLFAGDLGTNMNNFNFYWEGNGGGINANNVGIGTPCGTVFNGKLDVRQNATGPFGSKAIYAENSDISGGTFGTDVIGIKSFLPVVTGDFHRIAGWFESQAPIGLPSVAIFVPQNGGKVSIGWPTPYANTPGQLEVMGSIYTGLVLVTSDQSYKINVNNIDNAIDKIKKLNGVYFDWDTITYPNNNFESSRQVGLIAQNVDSVLPEVVRADANNKKYIAYDHIVALLIQGMKEQNEKIDSLTSQINSCCSSSSRLASNNNQNVDLASEVILYQNMPNPFGDETKINYFLPDNVGNAKMIFYDETGRLVKEEVIDNRGNGTVTVNASNLAAGIYSYSLEVNGRTIQTRKMQKLK